jgi:hypothetical protein
MGYQVNSEWSIVNDNFLIINKSERLTIDH